ncbi:MAG: hypothetical protein Q9227_005286 [Pyrenula ochraceoflavens]
MPGKKGGENTKKAAGNAKKAEVAAQKQAAVNAKLAAEEDSKWAQGAKSNAKKQQSEDKKAQAAAKKAERDAMLAAEEANQPSKPKNAGAKTAPKKTRGLDLSQLDEQQPSSTKANPALNASGIENALDALSLTGGNADSVKIDRHPERRYKAAYAAFEARRMPEIMEENPGLKKNVREERCRKEFDKSPENPFNQVHGSYNMSRDELAAIREGEKKKIEGRLAG